jgi:Tol biopolymer transport system component
MGMKRGFNSARRRAVWLRLVAVAAGIALLATLVSAILAVSAGVRIVDASPAVGSDAVPITAPIRIAFSQAMDRASVETRFRLEPETAGTLVWDGVVMAFQPHGALAPGTAYTITLEAGALSERGRPLRQDRTWRFRTRDPGLLYLGRPTPGAGLRQLYLAPANDRSSRQLTDHAHGVWDYAVHPQGEGIIYSVLREDGGSDLWRMDRDGANQRLLLACPGAACLSPAWSPDGKQLAYERRDIWAGAPNLDPNAGRIWLLDLERGEERPLFDYDVPLHSPVWSPGGERLAYASPLIPGVEVHDLRTGDLQQFGNEWVAAPVWSPDGRYLVLPELMMAGEAFVVRLVRVDLEAEELLDISGDDDFVEDVAPAWSPGGSWIAFGRRFLDDERWTPGRQIWLTRPGGQEAYALPAEGMADHFAFAWRPDGRALAYARADLSEGPQPVPDVSVWIFDFVQGDSRFVASDGVLPIWLP